MRPNSAIIAVVFVSVLIGDPVSAAGAAGASSYHQVDTDNTGPPVTGSDVQYQEGSGSDPVLVEDHFVETWLGNPDGVDVSVVDAIGFEPGTHGQRITDVFLANTSHASLVQIDGWGRYLLNGVRISGGNATGYIKHSLKHDGGIFWTATDLSPSYSQRKIRDWAIENGRPVHIIAREFATWMQDRNTLFISSLENPTSTGGLPSDPVYCDDFDGEASEGWIPLCGSLDDYIAHSGVGLANTVFVGAIDTRFGTDRAAAAIRGDGVFAPHAIYVESPDGTTSQATPVLAAYATNLAVSNPSWGAARLKQELMSLAREEVIDHRTGAATSRGVSVTERRTIRAIRPEFAPQANPPELPPMGSQDALDFPHFANGASVTSDFVLLNVAPHPIRPGLYFYDKGGDRIAAESVVEVTGDLMVTEDGALTVQTEMEPLGELTISTHGRGEVVGGSVRVVSNGSIGGVLRFDIPDIGVAGVGAGQPVRDALFPARRQVGGIRTGAAIRNLEAEAMVVSCQLMKDGAVLEEVDISLEANGQDARFIEELFTATDTSNFVGAVRCTAEGLFAGVAIELDADNRIFTTLPVVPVPPVRTQVDTQLHFAHFANGASIASDLVLVNVAAGPVRLSIFFYDQEGDLIAPAAVVDVRGDLEVSEDGALTFGRKLKPLGERTLATTGGGELKVGSVRVVSDGPIGGVLRFGHPELGVAGVGASQPLTAAVLPARRQADGINTGVAILNLGQDSIEVTCQLMQAGRALETKGVPLAGNGQSAQFIHELFTQTDTLEFVGLVRCAAPKGESFTGIALEMDAGSRIFTTLPVVPVNQ